jgi:hypothetical protein
MRARILVIEASLTICVPRRRKVLDQLRMGVWLSFSPCCPAPRAGDEDQGMDDVENRVEGELHLCTPISCLVIPNSI